MGAGELGSIIGGISWDGDIDGVVCKCMTCVVVGDACFGIVDERYTPC